MRRRLLVVLLATLAFPAAAGAVTPVYYPLPANVNVSQGIATAPNGDVWFAADRQTPGQSAPTTTVGRLRPSQGPAGSTDAISTFPTPVPANANCCANRVTSVAFDGPRNRLWFVQNDGVIGNADAAAVVPGATTGMVATRLAGRQGLLDVVPGPSGGAYFTENTADNSANYYGNRIAFAGDGLAIAEFDNLAKQSQGGALVSLRYDAKPAGITLDAQGLPWFTEADPGNPGYRIARGVAQGGPNGAGSYDEYLVQPCGTGNPCSGSYTGTGITDIAVAPDGSKWFTNQLKNQVGRFDGLNFTSYDLPAIDAGLSQGEARAITAAPDGSLLVVERGGISRPNANAIIRIDPSDPAKPTATVTHLGAGRAPLGVAADASGNVWFTSASDSPPSAIGLLAGLVTPAGTGGGGTTTPPGPTPPGTPPPVAPGPKPVVLTPSSVAPGRVDPPQVNRGTVLADQRCAAYDGNGNCRVIYIISVGEYVTAFPGAKTRAVIGTGAAAKKAKGIVLARKDVTTKKGTRKKVRITLGAKGRKLLKAKKKLRVYFTATQAGSGTTPPRVLRRARLTLRR